MNTPPPASTWPQVASAQPAPVLTTSAVAAWRPSLRAVYPARQPLSDESLIQAAEVHVLPMAGSRLSDGAAAVEQYRHLRRHCLERIVTVQARWAPGQIVCSRPP